MHPDALYARRALSTGALGYINKEHTTGNIVDAVRRVRDGNIYLCEETARQLLGRTAGGPKGPQAEGIESLSDRELQVFRLIGQGISSSQIAEHFHRNRYTVEAHRQAIKRKLNLKTAAELNRAAVLWVQENR